MSGVRLTYALAALCAVVIVTALVMLALTGPVA